MNVQTLDRDHLHHESGVQTQRLCPWPVLNAPFEGSWFVVHPGTASDPDRHHDYEMWIAIRGEALIDVDGERRRFAAGDILYLPPYTGHRVFNDGDRGPGQPILGAARARAERSACRGPSAGDNRLDWTA